MNRFQVRRSQGFTLIELMIVVAIIGVLASIAIPAFINYQLTSKRAEAYANLNALGKAQKAYFAEFNSFVSAEPEPGFSSSTLPTTTKRDMTPINAAYSEIGWVPDGDVFFDYDTATAADPLNGDCGSCTEGCFTSAAYGDLNGDLSFSVLIYAHPDGAGEYCTTGFNGGGTGSYHPPLHSNGTDRAFDQVARVLAADDF